jgi:hypothetical protein
VNSRENFCILANSGVAVKTLGADRDMIRVLFDIVYPASDAATFTQRLQNEGSLSALEPGKGVHRQKLDGVFRPSKAGRP